MTDTGQAEQAEQAAPPSRGMAVDKAVSTGDLHGVVVAGGGGGLLLEDILTALVQSKACAIKAECERDKEKRRCRAWRLLSHRSSKEPQAGHQITPVVHRHRHHHPLHHHHLHQHPQPPITLVPQPAALPRAELRAESPCSPCSSEMAGRAANDVTITGMCTTSDAPGLPSDSTLSPPDSVVIAVDDEDGDGGDGSLGARGDVLDHVPPLPLDPQPSRHQHPRRGRAAPPLRRTLSSRSHKYHKCDEYAAEPVPHASSWSCSASPAGTPSEGTPNTSPPATPLATPPASPPGSAAPSRTPSPPTPQSPEFLHRHLRAVHDEEAGELLDRPHGPRRKKRRRRRAGQQGAARGPGKGVGKGGGRRKVANATAAKGKPPDVRAHQLDPDDLPKRARWTIAVTACLLLVMSMLLVGVTLRMAPIIDEMVRKQNEEHMNMLNRANLVDLNGTRQGS